MTDILAVMENKTKWLNLIQNVDALIRQGRVDQARLELLAIKSTVPDKNRLALAKLCRRVGLSPKALKVLSNDKLKPVHENLPTEWLAEYALNLQRIGSVNEAIQILKPLESTEKHMSLAYCYMSLWDYSSAKVEVENFLNSNTDEYATLIAKVNLAACLVSLQHWGEAELLLNSLIVELNKRESGRLAANTYELLTQVHVGNEKYKQARSDIKKGLAFLGGKQTIDSFFLFKWQGVIEAIETNQEKPLLNLRERAVELAHWETVRDIDFHRLKVKFDPALRDYLYFGSRSDHYKQKVVEAFGQPSPKFESNPKSKTSFFIDQAMLNDKQLFKPGSKPHALLSSLFSDFYRGKKVGEIFGDLYTDEYFDIFSSPDRVHQVIRRLRKQLASSDINIDVKFEGSSFTASLGKDVNLVLSRPIEVKDVFHQRLEKIKTHFGSEEFTARQAAEILDISHSNTNRLLKKACENNNIDMITSGPKTHYKAS